MGIVEFQSWKESGFMVDIKSFRLAACAALLLFPVDCAISQSTAPLPNSTPPSADLASMELEKLMDIQVTTASLFSDKLSQAPGIMSVVTGDELRRFGGNTLGEVLDRVPGLTQSSQYFTDRSLVAADGDQTKTSGAHILFLINGRPTREVVEGGMISDLLESFPVEILDRIEVIRGPGSVLYGSNAFSAVVNLITRKAEGTEFSIHGLGGANDALSSSGHFLYRRGNFSLTAASQVHEVPNWNFVYLVPLAVQHVPGIPAEPPSHNVSLVDRGTGDYLGMNYKGLSFNSSFTEWQSTSFTQGSVGETRLSRDFDNLGYEHKIRDRWEMSFNGTYTRNTFGINAYPSISRDGNDFVAEWTNLITVSSRDRLTVGTLFNRIAGSEINISANPPVQTAGGSRPAGGFYAQLDHQFSAKLKVIGGFQTNKFAEIPVSTVPRVGAIWSPSRWASIKALYGVAFRPPAIDESTINRSDIQGNPNLLPETVGTFDLGLNLQFKRLQFGADYFHSKQTNSIVTISHAPIRYVNLGGVTFDGGEAEGKFYVNHDVFVQGSLLYQANHNQTGASNATPIPNFGFKSGIGYENSRGLILGLSELSDGKPPAYQEPTNPVPGWHNSMNGELRQDLSRFLHLGDRNSVAIAAHGNDLLNQAVWMPGFGFFNIDSIPVQQGRTIYAGLEYSLSRK